VKHVGNIKVLQIWAGDDAHHGTVGRTSVQLRTVEEAIREAHIEPAVGERPVMLQVPDPSMVCFF
jgi:hypothetical protein